MSSILDDIRRHQLLARTLKYYVSYDSENRITAVFSHSGDAPDNSINISESLAEKFLNGDILKHNYTVVQLGDSFVIEKINTDISITTEHSFYKIPTSSCKNMIYINSANGTLRFEGEFLNSNVFYVCAKNCFHILYKTILFDDDINIHVDECFTKDIDIFVPAHVENVGIAYE